MGSINDQKLPHIDFSGATEPGTATWVDVRAKVWKALEDFGCFEARFDHVPLELRNETLGTLEEMFDLPLETKLQNVSTKAFHGYVGQYPNVPLYESMGIDDAVALEKVDAVALEKVDAVAHTLWPQGRPDFSKTLHSYSEKLSELDKMIRMMVLESLGMEKYLEEHLNSTNYLLRVMKYKGPETTDTAVGLKPHTDKNIVTILYQNEVEGLEVQAKNGQWIKPSASHGSFLVMIGESLFAWVNGRLRSPFHRVMMTGNEARYSVGLFSIPKPGNVIMAPPELVDENHPLVFKPPSMITSIFGW